MSAVPPYSTDIKAAWEVIEKIAGDKKRGIAYLSLHGYEGRGFFCSLGKGDAGGDTAPLAICLAALKAIESTSLPHHTGDAEEG